MPSVTPSRPVLLPRSDGLSTNPAIKEFKHHSQTQIGLEEDQTVYSWCALFPWGSLLRGKWVAQKMGGLKS